MKLGALSSGSSESVSELLGEVGYEFGIAYQMYDDYLGIWGDPIITGKPAGIDLIEKKKSFPVLLGIQKDPHFASRLTSAEPIDSDCISSLIQTLHDLGVRNQAREKISQHLDEANKQLNDLRSTNDLDMQRLGNYVNSLFKIY